jgi:hypothetical protein
VAPRRQPLIETTQINKKSNAVNCERRTKSQRMAQMLLSFRVLNKVTAVRQKSDVNLCLCQDCLKCFLLPCEPVRLVHALAAVFGFIAAARAR